MTTNDQEIDKTRELSRSAVEGDRDIRGDVRDIVVDALVKHHVDKYNLKRVIDAVFDCALEGAPQSSKDVKDIMMETADGLDKGLSTAAEASKLAIEEAAGRIDEFSDKDIQRAVDDLKDLEDMFISSIKDLAKASQSATKGMFGDLAKHTERTGTATGRSVSDALETLGSMSKVKTPGFADVEKATRTGVATIASIASGILEGIADSARYEKPPEDSEVDTKE